MNIYQVVLKRGCISHPDVINFYDEDRETVIKNMQNYVKKNGFTIYTNEGRFTIADVLLRERTMTGKIISDTPYHYLFDENDNRREGT